MASVLKHITKFFSTTLTSDSMSISDMNLHNTHQGESKSTTGTVTADYLNVTYVDKMYKSTCKPIVHINQYNILSKYLSTTSTCFNINVTNVTTT